MAEKSISYQTDGDKMLYKDGDTLIASAKYAGSSLFDFHIEIEELGHLNIIRDVSGLTLETCGWLALAAATTNDYLQSNRDQTE